MTGTTRAVFRPGPELDPTTVAPGDRIYVYSLGTPPPPYPQAAVVVEFDPLLPDWVVCKVDGEEKANCYHVVELSTCPVSALT